MRHWSDAKRKLRADGRTRMRKAAAGLSRTKEKPGGMKTYQTSRVAIQALK